MSLANSLLTAGPMATFGASTPSRPVMGMTGWPPCQSRPRVARLSAHRRDAWAVRRATIQTC